MDSKRRLLPVLPSSTSFSSSSSSSSSTALGAGRLYGRGGVLAADSLSRGPVGKLNSDYQPRLPAVSRDYSSSESLRSRWKLSTPLSSSSSSVSREHPWTEPSYGGRSKPLNVGSDRGLGSYSGFLAASRDSESKRAKLSYTNRVVSGRTAVPASSSSVPASSSSVPASSSSVRPSLGPLTDSPWKSTISPLSRASSASSSSSAEGLWARREVEKRVESSQSGLGESSYRPSVLTSSLYRPERVTSTYAQGARPKESLYSSRRETGPSSRHLPTEYLASPLERGSRRLSSDYSPSPRLPRESASSSSTRTYASLSETSFLSFLNSSPYTAPSERGSSSSPYTAPSERGSSSSPYAPPSERGSSPPKPNPSPLPAPCPAPEVSEQDGRSSTRRLLSRLFSRRSSQESGSASPSNFASRSFDSTSEEVPPSENRPVVSSRESVEAELRSSDPVQAFAFLRRREQNLTPGQERANLISEAESVRAQGGLTWLNWNRCTPLFSRRRREGRDESARAEPPRHSPPLALPSLNSRKLTYRITDDGDDDDDEEEEEEEEGATAAAPAGASGLSSTQVQEASRLSGSSLGAPRVMSSPLFCLPENVIIGLDVGVEGRNQADEAEKPTPSRDPERLRKIQESLLLEESDEEEGDLCRICQMGEKSTSNPLIEPCSCTGSLQYVHQDCIKQWLRSKIASGSTLEAITTCELCKEKLHLNIENFDIHELYRSHEQSEYEFISCGLYLVVLLHLCEQRFSDVLGAVNEAGVRARSPPGPPPDGDGPPYTFFNLARTLHEHMDNLESSYAESDDEDVQDNRPSIDFCDLDEEDEEEEEF